MMRLRLGDVAATPCAAVFVALSLGRGFVHSVTRTGRRQSDTKKKPPNGGELPGPPPKNPRAQIPVRRSAAFLRSGDFYEMFFDIAVAAAEALDISLDQTRQARRKTIPMCACPTCREGLFANATKGFASRSANSESTARRKNAAISRCQKPRCRCGLHPRT